MPHPLRMNRLAMLFLAATLGCMPVPPAPKESAGPAGTASPAKGGVAAKTHDELTDSDQPNVREPLELRGHRVGVMTLDEFRKIVPVDSAEWFEDPHSPKASAKLHDGGMFAGKPVKEVAYSFYDGVLLSIHLAPVHVGDAQGFRNHLAEKYGPPDELAPLSVWRDDRATLFLVKDRDLLLFDRALGRKTVADGKTPTK